MTAHEIVANDVVSFEDVKSLAAASGPCITIAVHIPNPFELSVRLKNAVRRVEKTLAEMRVQPRILELLLAPIHNLATAAETAGVWSNALILFRSADVFRSFLLYLRVPEMERIEQRFQVGPLLSALTREQSFLLLGLSRRHIRLLRCTQHRADEVSTGDAVPRDMRVWMNTRQPDHVLENRASAGPSVGSMKGVTFGTSTDREREDQYIAHFFKEVDKGINTLLHSDAPRLLLAGVDYEVAIYRRVSVYPRLFEQAIHGSPDGIPIAELHERAMSLVMQTRSEALENALRGFEKPRNTKLVSSDVYDVVKAAWEGRLHALLVSEGASIQGRWNEEKQRIEPSEPPEDLLNAAALQTILHGGLAFTLEAKDMPLPGHLAAVLRY